MKSTFSIIFYLKRQVVKKDGTVPVMGRITVDGTQSQFSCKTTANPDLWDTKGGCMIGKSMQALEVNRKLDKMRVSISKHYQEIMDWDNFVTAKEPLSQGQSAPKNEKQQKEQNAEEQKPKRKVRSVKM